MSYKIGQLRKSNTTSYLTDLSWSATAVKTEGYAAKLFDDYAIRLSDNGNFNTNNTYYLRFSIKRIPYNDPRFSATTYPMTKDSNDPREMVIKLELLKHDGSSSNGEYERGTYQIIENSIAVEPYIPGVNTEYFSFETMFTSNAIYPYLGFILSRTTYDYLGAAPRDDVKANIDFGENGDVAIVNNILPRSSVDKIGVQSRPGSLICVNREPIRIGRTGTWEINNGVPITFVGFANPNGSSASNIDRFILDYAWDEA